MVLGYWWRVKCRKVMLWYELTGVMSKSPRRHWTSASNNAGFVFCHMSEVTGGSNTPTALVTSLVFQARRRADRLTIKWPIWYFGDLYYNRVTERLAAILCWNLLASYYRCLRVTSLFYDDFVLILWIVKVFTITLTLITFN